MKLKDFTYDLPERLIAQRPLENRSESRLLVLDKNTGDIRHKRFEDIFDFLEYGDCLVLNNTRVIPARLIGKKVETGSKIEILILKRVNSDIWEVITKPGKKAKVGSKFNFGNGELIAEVIDVVEDGNRLVRFEYDGIFEKIIDNLGILPLPPYIYETLDDKERYQTVYSKKNGSAAAPTAGLHFTNDLLEKLRDKGIQIVFLTLHVGLGTFRPVKVDNISEHKMHSEYFSISEDSINIIKSTKEHGKSVVAVGTTSCRVLETIGEISKPISISGFTDIFIYPGYNFKVVDKLITNFHLPESTLIMLVSALAGQKNVLNAYNEAIKNEYRFFSFGDAMLIT